MQPLYFEIESFDALRAALDTDLAAAIERAKALGDLPPRFETAA